MSRSLLIGLILVTLVMAAGCAKRNTAYQSGDQLELVRTIPVVGNPTDLDFSGNWLYVALDQGGLGRINTGTYAMDWYTKLLASDGSTKDLNRTRLVEYVSAKDLLFVYDIHATDQIYIVNTSNPDSLDPYRSITGATQGIRDMTLRELTNDPDGNLVELLYCLGNGNVYYGRFNGDLWLGSEFNITTPYPINGVAMDDNYVYMATDQRGIFIYNRQTQQFVSEIAFYGYAQKMALRNGILYVAARHGGLQVVDVSNPQQPVLVASYDTVGYATNLQVMNGKLAVSSGSGGAYYFDITNPTSPKLIQRITSGGYINDLVFSDDKLVLASRDAGILFYSLD